VIVKFFIITVSAGFTPA